MESFTKHVRIADGSSLSISGTTDVERDLPIRVRVFERPHSSSETDISVDDAHRVIELLLEACELAMRDRND